jgi:hypothetical protein
VLLIDQNSAHINCNIRWGTEADVLQMKMSLLTGQGHSTTSNKATLRNMLNYEYLLHNENNSEGKVVCVVVCT